MGQDYSQDTDHEIILEGLRAGHPTACRIVEGWLRQAVRSPRFGIPVDDVDDLVQESLTQVLDRVSPPDFKVHTSLKAFCRHVAMARCVDGIRRRRMLVELSPLLAEEFADPLERIARKEDLSRVHGALSQLKTLCRDLIRWHFTEEKSYKLIAQETGRNASTLRVHMFNCLEALRRLVQV
nr:sigma-70 family RNA polymerase sigma factor [Candidatus Krumholzibacteria bacterium]